ncbi:polyamine aminopropyltransferase [Catenovulum sediminis]|uniref:Polyamine aminopropyltransferase n=1 Tax=Catenovulum sediminis TaxID=1740262 RepID=A0ABV1RN10_9ALTE
MPTLNKQWRLWLTDAMLIFIMAVLAGCGLIYEYLLSHYAGRVLGAVEHAIYTTIGLMIVFMGIGSFAARKIADEFTGFAWLEVLLGIVGATSVLFIAMLIGFTFTLPQILSHTFALPADVIPSGGIMQFLYQAARFTPYIAAAILGFMIGIEIPLIARVREKVYQKHLTHNAGTIYGADYIGAGVGAAVWILWMMSLEINQAAVYTGTLNLVAGVLILVLFWSRIRWRKCLLLMQLLSLFLIVMLALNGNRWMQTFTDMLYMDKVVYQQQTEYQQIVISERNLGPSRQSVLNLYLNGRLQFSSADEKIYHEMLVHPVMAASARLGKVLVIGGGDGLAAREIFKWPVQQLDMIELDPQMIELFKQPEKYLPPKLAQQIIDLNQHSLVSDKLNVMIADAFNQVDLLLEENTTYDAIIVDLPDPNHPDLNKLYTTYFYQRLAQLLSADGAMVIQSTSPYHAKDAFISIAKTLGHAGLQNVEQYHQNVPSFGEWGWTIATKQGLPASVRIIDSEYPANLDWLTAPLLHASFVFPKNFYQRADQVKVNHLGSQTLFLYHDQAWRKQQGLLSVH